MRKLLPALLALVMFLAGCAYIGRPTVTQLAAKPPIFLLAFPLGFSAGDQKQQFFVPSGFVTDLASIPRFLWWWEAPHEGTMAPAIVHDFLYWEQPCTKSEADAVMYVAMKQAGMKDASIELVYDGVRTPIGQAAWDENKAARASGEVRFFTSRFSSQLANGALDSKATLATIQAEAIAKKETSIPNFSLATIKAVCKEAAREFEALRAM